MEANVLGQMEKCTDCKFRKLYHLPRGDVWDCKYNGWDCAKDPPEPDESEILKNILLEHFFGISQSKQHLL